MSEEKLNEKYICKKTLLDENDELVPIIRKMLSEAYINGLEQGKFDNQMELINLKTVNEEHRKINGKLREEIKKLRGTKW